MMMTYKAASNQNKYTSTKTYLKGNERELFSSRGFTLLERRLTDAAGALDEVILNIDGSWHNMAMAAGMSMRWMRIGHFM